MPTEEEWEYACRAGTTTAFFWGDDPGKAGEYGWFKENSAGGDFPQTTHPLGKLRPNPFGLYDIVGNVAEWGGKPGGSAPHVARGGAFSTAAAQLRSASRLIETPEWDELDPEYPHSPWWLTAEFVRFRLALDATEPLKK